jgi:hypothetical protein
MTGCASSPADPVSMEQPASDSGAASSASPATGAAVVSVSNPSIAPSASASGEPAPLEDTLGGLAPGALQDEVEKKIGKPKSKSPIQEEQATGEHVSQWIWADGVSAIMSGSSAKGKLAVRLLMIEPPSKLSTGRGVGIGSPRSAVEAAYAKQIDKQASTEEMLVVGEMLGGLRVHFDKQQRVRSLALGSDGE